MFKTHVTLFKIHVILFNICVTLFNSCVTLFKINATLFYIHVTLFKIHVTLFYKCWTLSYTCLTLFKVLVTLFYKCWTLSYKCLTLFYIFFRWYFLGTALRASTSVPGNTSPPSASVASTRANTGFRTNSIENIFKWSDDIRTSSSDSFSDTNIRTLSEFLKTEQVNWLKNIIINIPLLQVIFHFSIFQSTVKPEHNYHPWDP